MVGLTPWADLEVRARVVYEQQPIVQVICQITFPEKILLRSEDPIVVGAFQSRIEGKYPQTSLSYNATIDFTLQAPGMPLLPAEPSPRIPVRNFFDQESNWTVTLAPEFLALSCRQYRSFDEFQDRWHFVLESCIDTIRPTLLRRLGLRYINEIRDPKPSYINPELAGILSSSVLGPSVVRAAQNIALRNGNMNVTLQHGLYEIGTTVQPTPDSPAPDRPFYLLDIDVAREFPRGAEKAVAVTGVSQLLDEFHEVESRLFRWAISDEYHESLLEAPHHGNIDTGIS